MRNQKIIESYYEKHLFISLFKNYKFSIFQFSTLTLFFLITACTDRKPVLQKSAYDIDHEDQNLISNGDVEIMDNGLPVGWDTSNDAVGQSECAVDSPGFQSNYALTISVEDANADGIWNTEIRNIKPNTKYTLSFWYRLPQNGKLEILLFGNNLPVTKMFRYNPMHWCRYSAIIDSGNCSGDCQIGFLANNGTKPFKFWIDQIELYEGESPIGKNCARLEYQYYDTAYVSPDIVSPLPFAFEWTFDNDRHPEEIQYVVELPSELELVDCALGRMCKWPPDGWGITWTRPDYTSQVKTEKITVNHRPYIRVVAHVPYMIGDQKQFTNYVVPVGIRDYWEWSLGLYSGTTSMCLYVRTKVGAGSFPFYYYARWGKGEQPRKKLYLEVTSIPEAVHPSGLCLISDIQLMAGEKNPQIVKDVLHIGLNGIEAGSLELHGGEGELRSKIDAMHSSGLRYFSRWINIPIFGVEDPEAKAMDITGQRTGLGGWCLSYRGQDWVNRVNEYKKKLEMGINFFAFDDVNPCSCFCDKCKSLFTEFLRTNTELSYVDPSTFMNEKWIGNGEYRTLWVDFSLWHYGKTAQDMKDEIFQHAKSKGLNGNIYFGISSWLPFTHAFAAESLTAFDFDIRQTYLNWWSIGYGGSPKMVGDVLFLNQEKLGRYARPLAPTLSPGLSYMHPACALDPHAQMKYQILEAMMAPKFVGYIMYAGRDIDACDMKYMGQANTLMSRFENIIMNGTALKPIEINEWSAVRIKKLDSQGLILVSDYSTYTKEEKIIQFSSDDLTGEILVNIENGEVVKPVSGTYEVRIKDERVRIFYYNSKAD